MRNKHSIRPVVLFAMSIGLILLSGCETFNHSKKSREVTFGVRTYSSLATKTVYSGEGLYDNNGKLTLERINWEEEDEIRIYSPEVVRRFSELNNDEEYHWADYSIVGTIDNTVNNGRSSQAKLQPLNKDTDFSTGNGLFWSDDLVGQTASFYAVYPAPAVDDVPGLTGNNNVGWAPAGAKGTISCSLPGTQTFSEKGNMEYAYMTACAPNVAFEENVDLKFYPAYTAFEFHMAIDASGVDELYFGKFKLFSTESSLFGDYSVICNTSHPDNPAYECPTYSDGTTGDDPTDANNYITVDLDGYKLVKSGEGNTELVFTVFALPQTLKKLSISFEVGSSVGTYVTRTLDFKKTTDNVASWLTFGGCKKHVIKGLAIKGEMWQLEIDGQVLHWTSYEETIDQKITFEPYDKKGDVYYGRAVVVGGAIESQVKWMGTSGTNAAGLNKDNHYADSKWKLYGEAGYGEGTNNYDKNFQIRTLDNRLAESERYFTMTFTPTAPTGGYWKLIPQFRDGDDVSPQHFRYEVVNNSTGTTSNQLTGPIINSSFTVKIYPVDWTPSTYATYDVWFECFVSPSVNFTPSLNADSELQDVHGDGRFSYWVFRLAYYTQDYHDDE